MQHFFCLEKLTDVELKLNLYDLGTSTDRQTDRRHCRSNANRY